MTPDHESEQLRLIATISRLTRERDELRNALEQLANEMQVANSSGKPRSAKWFESRIKRARAALAKPS